MIRPLEYCQQIEHIEGSLRTIDLRIAELLELRIRYQEKAATLQNEAPNDEKEDRVVAKKSPAPNKTSERSANYYKS